MSRQRIYYLTAGALLTAVLMGWFIFKGLPDLLAREQGAGFGPQSEEQARSDVRTAALQFFGGLVLVLGTVFTALTLRQTRMRDQAQRRADQDQLKSDRERDEGHRRADEERLRIEREGQIDERFTRAIDQLGSAELRVRLGGMYALERIAVDASETYHPLVVEVLTAYVRECAQPSSGDARSSSLARSGHRPKVRPKADVQAALTVLGRREHDRDDPRFPLRLSGAYLRGVSLRGGHFENARLRRVNLEEAHLEGTQLQGAKLRDARLVKADLKPDDDNPELKGANLTGASLVDANLHGAKLQGAILTDAILTGATLTGARHDPSTVWPRGFDAEVAGSRPVETSGQEDLSGPA
jgi:hypothetical protein